MLTPFVSQAITMLVKNVKHNQISETQLQVLLGYAEEDIYDQSRQATAFGLLKVAGQIVFCAKSFRTNPPWISGPLSHVFIRLSDVVSASFRQFCPGSSSFQRWRRL